MTVTLFTLGLIIFASALLDSSLEQIRSKVDVNIYFNIDAPEDEIFALQQSLERLPEVAEAIYISRDQALENFRDRHKNDYLTIQALDELGENPLGASLGVKAKETSQYESIAKFLQDKTALAQGEYSIVDNINYEQNKVAIEKLTKIIDGAQKLGLALAIFLIVVSIIITLNTVRLAIYIAREEIAVMRLVGANNRYIRGPFIVEGIMYGVFSAIIALALFYPVTLWLGDTSENFFGGINLFEYYVANFGQVFLMIILAGVLLGAISSYLAVRKYLRL